MSSASRQAWETVPFGSIVAHSAFGPRFSGELYSEEGNVATLRTTDLSPHGEISYHSMPRADVNLNKFENHLLKLGDLVISRSGRVGTAAVFKSFDLPVLPGAFLIRFRMGDRADPLFYRYFFNSELGRPLILSVARGAAQQNINISNVELLPVPCPPMREQAGIVAILSEYDNLIENNRRRIALLQDAARQLYKEWFVRFRFPSQEHLKVNGDLPQGWERLKLGDLLTLQRGFDLPTADRAEGEVPVFGSTGIVGYHDTAKVQAPMVITGRSGSLGKVCFVSTPCWPLNTALWVREFKRVSPWYAYFLLLEMGLEKFNGGASVPTLDRNVAHAADVLLPSPRLLKDFDEAVRPSFALIDNLQLQNIQLAKARDLLLLKLMNGTIAV